MSFIKTNLNSPKKFWCMSEIRNVLCNLMLIVIALYSIIAGAYVNALF